MVIKVAVYSWLYSCRTVRVTMPSYTPFLALQDRKSTPIPASYSRWKIADGERGNMIYQPNGTKWSPQSTWPTGRPNWPLTQTARLLPGYAMVSIGALTLVSPRMLQSSIHLTLTCYLPQSTLRWFQTT